MLGIASHQFAPNLGIQSLPESGKIGGRLDRPLIGSEQMNHNRGSIGANLRCFVHAEKVLQAGGDPRWLATLVVNSGLAAFLQANSRRGEFMEAASTDLLL